MKNERTVYTTHGAFLYFHFSFHKGKNENRYNGSYFYFSFFVWGVGKRKMILSYPFPIFYHEIKKRKTKGRYIHGPLRRWCIKNYSRRLEVSVKLTRLACNGISSCFISRNVGTSFVRNIMRCADNSIPRFIRSSGDIWWPSGDTLTVHCKSHITHKCKIPGHICKLEIHIQKMLHSCIWSLICCVLRLAWNYNPWKFFTATRVIPRLPMK